MSRKTPAQTVETELEKRNILNKEQLAVLQSFRRQHRDVLPSTEPVTPGAALQYSIRARDLLEGSTLSESTAQETPLMRCVNAARSVNPHHAACSRLDSFYVMRAAAWTHDLHLCASLGGAPFHKVPLGSRRRAPAGRLHRHHNTQDRARDNSRTTDATQCGIRGGTFS